MTRNITVTEEIVVDPVVFIMGDERFETHRRVTKVSDLVKMGELCTADFGEVIIGPAVPAWIEPPPNRSTRYDLKNRVRL